MTDIGILESFGKYFSQKNFMMDALRTIGWLIMQLLMFLCELIESSFNELFKWLSFSVSDLVNVVIDNPTTRTLIVTAAIFSTAFAFFVLIFNRKKIDLSQLPTNVLIFVFTMIGLPAILGLANEMFTDVSTFIGMNGNTATETIVIQNIADLRYLDQTLEYNKAYLDDNGDINTVKNYISGKTNSSKIIKSINPNEVIKFDDELLTKDIYKNKIDYGSDGVATLVKIGSSKGELFGYTLYDFTSYYYRYTIDWFPLYLSLIAIIIALFFASFKVVKISLEIAQQRLLAPIFAGATISSQQKTKQILTGIVNSYIVLVYICLSIKLLYLSITFATANFNPILASMSTVAIALATIDGPHWVERLFGIDAGLGAETVKQLYYGAKSIAGLGKAAAKGMDHLKNGVDKLKEGAERLSGFGHGISDGLRASEDQFGEENIGDGSSSDKKEQNLRNSTNTDGTSDQGSLLDQSGAMDESSPFDNADVMGGEAGPGNQFNPFDQPATGAQVTALKSLAGMSEDEAKALSKGEASQILQNAGLDKSFWDGMSQDDFGSTETSPLSNGDSGSSVKTSDTGSSLSGSDTSTGQQNSQHGSQPGLADETISFEKSGGKDGEIEKASSQPVAKQGTPPKPSMEKSLRDSTKIEKYRIDMAKQGKDMKGRPSLDTRREKAKKIKESNNRIGYNTGRLIANKFKKKGGNK